MNTDKEFEFKLDRLRPNDMVATAILADRFGSESIQFVSDQMFHDYTATTSSIGIENMLLMDRDLVAAVNQFVREYINKNRPIIKK